LQDKFINTNNFIFSLSLFHRPGRWIHCEWYTLQPTTYKITVLSMYISLTWRGGQNYSTVFFLFLVIKLLKRG
jgi:hypothetical protein